MTQKFIINFLFIQNKNKIRYTFLTLISSIYLLFCIIFAPENNNSFTFLIFMIDRPILNVLLNNVEKLFAYDIFASYRMVTFCTSPDKEAKVYDIFGFCIKRLTSYKFKTYIFYVIQ